MYKRIKILTTLFLVSACALNAQIDREISKVGTAAAQFLKIGPGARALGMGGTYAAVSDDIYAAYWNPAGITRSKQNIQAAFNHTDWLADISFDYAAFSINVEDVGTIFTTVTAVGVPEEKVRTYEYPEGDGRYWDATDMAIGLGFARNLTDRFSIGFQAKYIQQRVWNSSAIGFALDVGTYYITPFNNLVIGASISNFGTKMQLSGRDIQFNADPDGNVNYGPNNIPAVYEMGKFDIPLLFRIGLAMDAFSTRYTSMKLAVDATHPSDNTEYLNLGTEIDFMKTFFVRVGYKSLFLNNSEQSLTFGFGLNYEIQDNFFAQVNYAYGDYGRLKNIQYIDIGIFF